MKDFNMRNFVELFLALKASQNKEVEKAQKTVYIASISSQFEDVFNKVLKSQVEQERNNKVLTTMMTYSARNSYLNNRIFQFDDDWFRDEMADFAKTSHLTFNFDFQHQNIKICLDQAKINHIINQYDYQTIDEMKSVIDAFNYYSLISEEEIKELMLERHYNQVEYLLANQKFERIIPSHYHSPVLTKKFLMLKSR